MKRKEAAVVADVQVEDESGQPIKMEKTKVNEERRIA
jgi:hypothetical protein